MIAFCSSVDIGRQPEVVFDFFANLHLVPQAENSPVLALEMTTPGPPGLGSRYREVVRMLPFFDGEFLSEVTAFEPPRVLEETWTGPAMTGRDRYELAEIPDGTKLVHQKRVSCPGLLRVMEPFMRKPLFTRLEERLKAVKRGLEEGLYLPEGGALEKF
jgi:hypothetical protein